jgi:hypothetical protein
MQERERLLDLVKRGQMTPEQAETEAARRGLPKFAHVPPPEDFDPMQETSWSLVMVLAWILWRTADEVRNQWDAYRFKCLDWVEPYSVIVPRTCRYKPRVLEGRAATNIQSLWRATSNLDDGHSGCSEPLMSLAEATNALLLKLRDDALRATEISKGSTISSDHWSDLSVMEAWDQELNLGGMFPAEPPFRYLNWAFDREQVTSIWSRRTIVEFPRTLPPTIMPTGAQWIVTQGGVSQELPTEAAWQDAFKELIPRLASEEIKVIGIRERTNESVSGIKFASCQIVYPFADLSCELAMGDELYLKSDPYIDENRWREGVDDSLKDRSGYQWRRLMVLKSEVLRYWPFSTETQSPAQTVFRTGAPGRPTSMFLVETEFLARLKRGETLPWIGEESEILCAWLKKTHRNYPPLTARTIENRLRPLHREHREQMKPQKHRKRTNPRK